MDDIIFSFMSFLRARIVSLEPNQVVLRGAQDETITLPRTAIEGSVIEGQEVSIIVTPLEGEMAGQTQVAKALLNELLSR